MKSFRRRILFLILVYIIVLIKPLSFTHAQEASCTITDLNPSLPGKDSNISVRINISTSSELDLFLQKEPLQIFNTWIERIQGPVTKIVDLGKKDPGNYTVWLQYPTVSKELGRKICSQPFEVGEKEGEQFVNATKEERLKNVCRSIVNDTVRGKCEDCFLLQKVWTAFGCIDTKQPTAKSQGFISTLIAFGAGLAGGIAFLLILFGGFQIITSAGNPERLNAGRELVTSAIAGLLLIIFSIFLLKIIGVDILGIPDFK